MRHKSYENMFDPLGVDKNKSDFVRMMENKAAQSAAQRGDSAPTNLGPNARRAYENAKRNNASAGGSFSAGDSGVTLDKTADAIERLGQGHEHDPKVFRQRQIAILLCVLAIVGLYFLIQLQQ